MKIALRGKKHVDLVAGHILILSTFGTLLYAEKRFENDFPSSNSTIYNSVRVTEGKKFPIQIPPSSSSAWETRKSSTKVHFRGWYYWIKNWFSYFNWKTKPRPNCFKITNASASIWMYLLSTCIVLLFYSSINSSNLVGLWWKIQRIEEFAIFIHRCRRINSTKTSNHESASVVFQFVAKFIRRVALYLLVRIKTILDIHKSSCHRFPSWKSCVRGIRRVGEKLAYSFNHHPNITLNLHQQVDDTAATPFFSYKLTARISFSLEKNTSLGKK